MSYCKSCGGRLPEDAQFCPSCGAPINVSTAKTMETHQIFKVTDKPRVIVTNTAPGLIEVKSGPEGEVVVDMDLKEREQLSWNIVQTGDVLTVTCRPKVNLFFGWPMYVFQGGPKADIFITLPAESDVNLENRLDRIEVTGVKGNIVAESSTGKIDIHNCEGTIRAETKTGLINMDNTSGTVQARNITGPIRFNGVLPEGENWFRTKTGDIEVILQDKSNLTVEASTRLGRITSTPELIDARYDRGLYTGRVGAGTGKLVLETKTGSIVIRQ